MAKGSGHRIKTAFVKFPQTPAFLHFVAKPLKRPFFRLSENSTAEDIFFSQNEHNLKPQFWSSPHYKMKNRWN